MVLDVSYNFTTKLPCACPVGSRYSAMASFLLFGLFSAFCLGDGNTGLEGSSRKVSLGERPWAAALRPMKISRTLNRIKGIRGAFIPGQDRLFRPLVQVPALIELEQT